MALRPITENEFGLFQKLIFEHAGIYLQPVKKMLLSGRLARRLRELDLDTFREYYNRIATDGSGEELAILLDAITTNETHFFREPRHFDFLQEHAYPRWKSDAEQGKRHRSLRFWSAACSSGEEPYSLAMSLLTHFPVDSGWHLDILASDLCRDVLATAEAGLWPVRRAAEIPQPLLKQFMLKGIGSQEGLMKASRDLAAPIRFDRINLNDDRYPVARGLDAIFCRNVLIYFNRESRLKVINRLLDLLAPGGYLFLGHAESLSGMTDRVRTLAPAIYTTVENR